MFITCTQNRGTAIKYTGKALPGRTMLFYHFILVEYLCNGILIISVFVLLCAVYAYSVNSRLPDNDSKKKDFHPAALVMVAFTWPLFLLLFILLFVLRIITFVLRAILYGIFLILFTLALAGIRKPFLFIWLDKIMISIGNRLLEANTLLVKFVSGQWTNEPGTT